MLESWSPQPNQLSHSYVRTTSIRFQYTSQADVLPPGQTSKPRKYTHIIYILARKEREWEEKIDRGRAGSVRSASVSNLL